MEATLDLSNRLPTKEETSKAYEAFRKLATVSAETDSLSLLTEGAHPVTIEVPHSVGQLIVELLRYIGTGKAVTFVPFGAELTTQQAADMLNVSRPFLIQLLESGKIDFHKVGSHRRVNASDIFEYRSTRSDTQKAALAELAHLGQEIDAG